MHIKSIGVYCGARLGKLATYVEAAEDLAKVLVENNISLVYGGANVGIMGYLADSMLAKGGRVVGVIPQGLVDKEIAHHGIQELHVVESMHQRKAMMAELSDGFIALPGGVGTLEEFFEIWTWAQLGIHAKPFGLLNVANYFDKLIDFCRHMVAHGFLQERFLKMIQVSIHPQDVINAFMYYQAPVARWSEQDDTFGERQIKI